MRRARRALEQVVAAITAAALIWLAGLIWFVYSEPPAVSDRLTATDAIVVVTGGSLRVARGLELLEAGKARKLFVSGVNQQVDLDALLNTFGHPQDRRSCCIVLGHDADNTIGNAEETARWMRVEGYHSLRLVTGWYHMRRSVLEFERAMPGVAIIAHPVFPEQVKQQRWWAHPGTAVLMINEYDKYLAAVVRPLIERAAPGLLPEEMTAATRGEPAGIAR